MRKLLLILGATTFLAFGAQADFLEGVLAYQYKQYPTALAEFTYLSEEGNPAAAYYLGKMYQDGLGVLQNNDKAFALFQAADSGYYYPATVELGKMLLKDFGRTTDDTERGLKFLKRATHAGEAEAAYELGQLYANANNPGANLNYAHGYYLISALKGNMKAQYALAKLYFEGRGVPQDYVEALKWLGRSANQGYVLAQIELADIRMINPRLKNAAKAYSWYSIIAAYNEDEIGKKARDKRDVLAEELDSKVLSDAQKEVSAWRPKSADQSVPEKEQEETKIPTIPGFNDPQSMQEVLISEGILLRDGFPYGVTTTMVDNALATQDVAELTEAIEKAAKRGKKTAYGYYADLYKTRLNNLEEAFNWYKKGAEAGDVYAAYQVAKMYCEGKGTSQPDAVSCYAWLKVAQEERNPVLNGLVQDALATVRANATPEEISAGEEMLKTLKKSPEEKQEEKSSTLNFF